MRILFLTCRLEMGHHLLSLALVSLVQDHHSMKLVSSREISGMIGLNSLKGEISRTWRSSTFSRVLISKSRMVGSSKIKVLEDR